MPEATNASPAAAPKVSVIVPLFDWRDRPLDCIRSWTHRQSLSRDRYEILVVGNGVNPPLEREIAALLPPQDRLLHTGVPNEIELYNEGAKAARGEVLLFTENHCMAAGDCLERLAAWFDANPEMDGAMLNSTAAQINTFARMEDLNFEEKFKAWSNPGHWHKALLRGFALRRPIFAETGGFDARHHLFADVLMSAKLRDGHRKIGYAESASIVHLNTTSFSELFEHICEYAGGEILFRALHDAAYCEKYFGHAEEWSRRLAMRPDVAAELSAALAQARPSRALWRQRLSYGLARLFGPRVYRWAAGLRVLKTRARYAFWWFNEARRYAAFRDWWMLSAQYARVSEILKSIGEPLPVACAIDLEGGHAAVPMARFPEPQLVCFHGLEAHEKKTFRWSAPVAQMRLRLPAGRYEVALDTAGLRGEPGAYMLYIAWNGRPVERSRWRVDGGTIAFELPEGAVDAGDQRLTLVAQPIDTRGSAETRALGVPVHAISFRALDGSAAPAERQLSAAAPV